ncbi:MAG: 3D domain-containing protein [Brevundimonas sp.]|uniref:3D domain-containing protein n=1 Tax=Brevundimonas sp. TaxID=1871086 RepID=UPI00391B397A
MTPRLASKRLHLALAQLGLAVLIAPLALPSLSPLIVDLREESVALASAPDWRLSARLYHAGGGGATGRDSLGCWPVAYRTVAIDPRVVPRRTVLFIHETVGLPLPDGSVHDGYWYASDTGGAIRGNKIDLYTGHGRASMQPVSHLNIATLSVTEMGRFEDCPPPRD